MFYRFLSQADQPQVRLAFLKAFADYFVDSQMTEEQFANHLGGTAVRLDLSVGAFAGDELVGLLLNGIDVWDGQLTAYDAGTGVVPAHRGHGVAGEMFRFAVPRLRESGVRRCLLEVIKENEPAIKTYRELGFSTTRELQCLKRPAEPFPGAGAGGGFRSAAEHRSKGGERSTGGSRSAVAGLGTEPAGFRSAPAPGGPSLHIEEVREPAWDHWVSFWDWQPSWQNSPGSVTRLGWRSTVLGAHHEGRCVGYVIFVPRSGRILQIAVAGDSRRQGVGARLLRSVRAQVAADRELSIINVDSAASGTVAFLRASGFVPTIAQYEMTLAL